MTLTGQFVLAGIAFGIVMFVSGLFIGVSLVRDVERTTDGTDELRRARELLRRDDADST